MASVLSSSRSTAHPFGERYAGRMGPLPGTSQPWVDGLRQAGRAALTSSGLPGPKVEAWRYTSLAELAKVAFIPAATADDVEVASVPSRVPRLDGFPRLVLVNGVLRRDLSDVAANAFAVPLRDALNGGDPAVRAVLGKIAPVSGSPISALNTSFLSEGLVVSAQSGAPVRLQIVSIGAAGAEPAAFHPRIVLTASDGADVTVAVHHVGLPGQSYLSNPVTEISIGRGATVRNFVDLAEDGDAFHLGLTAVNLAANGSYEDFRLALGGGLIRQDVTAIFSGDGGRVTLNGAYALAKTEHHELATTFFHDVPNCNSEQIVRGVAAGRSRAVFQGRIRVAPNAQKTDARQNHKALFLDAGPKIDCKPELEIFADDVQCAHGAATGEIDHDQLFYLLSRGIDPDTARALLVAGFLDDVVSRLSIDVVREAFAGAVSAWLKTRVVSGGVP